VFVRKLQLPASPLFNPRHRQVSKNKAYNFHTFKATHSTNNQNSLINQVTGKLRRH